MTALPIARTRTRPLISWRVRKLLIGYSYLVPAALCMLATVVVPIILAIKMSLYADVLYKPQDYRFIGLGNYVRLVQDPAQAGFVNSFPIGIVSPYLAYPGWGGKIDSDGVPLIQQAILGKISAKECLDRFADILKKEMS